MPIYAYRCESCGHAKDVLQKLSDPLLTACPACGAETFRKQLTAAGFQLKGSGWYVTDFKGGAATASKSDEAESAAKPADGDKPATASPTAPATTPATAPATTGADAAGTPNRPAAAPASPPPATAASATKTSAQGSSE